MWNLGTSLTRVNENPGFRGRNKNEVTRQQQHQRLKEATADTTPASATAQPKQESARANRNVPQSRGTTLPRGSIQYQAPPSNQWCSPSPTVLQPLHAAQCG